MSLDEFMAQGIQTINEIMAVNDDTSTWIEPGEKIILIGVHSSEKNPIRAGNF